MAEAMQMRQGKVIQATGALYQVKSDDGVVYLCELRGRLRLQNFQLTNPIVVGDQVSFQPNKTNQSGVIHTIMPRHNLIMRQATRKRPHGQLLAANLDQALLIATATNLKNQLTFIDRFLVVATAFSIPPIVLFNKLDLLPESQLAQLSNVQSLYESLGYKTLAVSAYTQAHISHLRELLTNKTSLLSGHSGVGKSTLLNVLSPEARQAVADPGASKKRGQHTTTYSVLLEIAPDTFVIDSPGIQTLVPYAIEQQALGHYFPEISCLSTGCRFYNCTHLREPHCAVLRALEQGKIASSRYDSYRTMMHDAE